MKFRMGRVPKHYTFEYTPRYYDPEEEKSQAEEIDYNEGDAAEKLKMQIRRNMRSGASQFGFRTQRSEAVTQSNRRLLLIIAVMVFLGFLLMNSTRIERIFQAFNEMSAQ
jgi:hypothetical protein